MNRNDWLVPLIAGMVGIIGTLCGGMVAGYYQERATIRYMQLEQAKSAVIQRTAAVKVLKDAGVRYMAANEAFVSAVKFASDKVIFERFSDVQLSGAELQVIADDDLARLTNAVNDSCAQVLIDKNHNMAQRLEALQHHRTEWMSQLKRSLAAVKIDSEEGFQLSSHKARLLKR